MHSDLVAKLEAPEGMQKALTDEMVERALVAWFDAEVTWDRGMTPPLRARMMESMRAAINAALKALEARDG